MRLKHLIIGACSASALTAAAFGAQAQAQTQTPAADTNTPGTVGEIIVTAQKREQRLQDVPVEVTVANQQQMQDAGVKDIKDLAILTPGMIVTSSTTEASTTVRIRGIGTVGDNPGLESSVGVTIDGIYRPRNGVALEDLGEVSQVEVLKGPQGTLFGKNATAGELNIVTAQPTFTDSVAVELTGGDYNDERVTASINGGLVPDKLAGRLFIGEESRDGFDSVITGAGPRIKTDDMDRQFGTIRGQLLWLPSSTVDVRLIGDYTHHDENCCTAVAVVDGPFEGVVNALGAGPGAGGVQNPVVPDSRTTFANRSTSQTTTDYGGSIETNWQTPWFGGAKLTSLTGVRSWDSDQGQDSDFTTLDILYRQPKNANFTIFDQATEELRLAGQNGPFTWTVGGLFGNEKLISSQTLTIGSQMTAYLDTLIRQAALASGTPGTPNFIGIETPGPTGGLGYILGASPNFTAGGTEFDLHHQIDDSGALFANTDFKVTDQITATAGVRWTDEDKTVTSHYQNIGGNGTCNLPLILGGAPQRSNASGAAAGDLTQQIFVGYYCAAFNDATFNNLTLHEKHDDDKVTGTAKLSWKPSDQVYTYLSWANGFKAGGFNLDRERVNFGTFQGVPAGTPGADLPNGALAPNGNTSFAAETVDSYEAGIKTTWLGGKLLLDAAAFYQDYSNFQLNAFDGIAFSVYSIPKLTTQGVDFDVLWQTPLPGFSLDGGVTYADTRYGQNLPGFNNPTSAFFIGPTAAQSGALFRLSGGQESFAPLWSASLAGTYQHSIGNLMFRANLSAKFTSKYDTGSDLDPLKEQGELVLVNGRIGIGAPDQSWAVELWSENLTNRHYEQVAFDGTLQPNQIDAFLGAPRTFGLTLRLKPKVK